VHRSGYFHQSGSVPLSTSLLEHTLDRVLTSPARSPTAGSVSICALRASATYPPIEDASNRSACPRDARDQSGRMLGRGRATLYWRVACRDAATLPV
jgi:hypothetical protein